VVGMKLRLLFGRPVRVPAYDSYGLRVGRVTLDCAQCPTQVRTEAGELAATASLRLHYSACHPGMTIQWRIHQ
jgi:hypothetical protein